MRFLFLLLCFPLTISAKEPSHRVVFSEEKTFAGWPANVGLWVWDEGKEAVVGFITGPYQLRNGHNIQEPYTNRLARTLDGGKTWTVEKADGFYQPKMPLRDLEKGIAFGMKDLAIRFVSEGYHGGGPTRGSINLSADRGRTWSGPFSLPELIPSEKNLGRNEITSRTDYLPLESGDCLVFGSARPADRKLPDRAFVAKLVEGGTRAEFLSWIQPNESTDRTLMPSTVRVGKSELLTALRVRKADADVCWIDLYRSNDLGRGWKHLSKVGDTGTHNGNPPALVRLRDGRLCCAYGDRTRKKLFARLSNDSGKTWGDEVVLRDDYHPDEKGEIDFGYPRIFQNCDGDLVVLYYFATKEKPTNFIAATLWNPGE
jgi:hypothetical protein